MFSSKNLHQFVISSKESNIFCVYSFRVLFCLCVSCMFSFFLYVHFWWPIFDIRWFENDLIELLSKIQLELNEIHVSRLKPLFQAFYLVEGNLNWKFLVTARMAHKQRKKIEPSTQPLRVKITTTQYCIPCNCEICIAHCCCVFEWSVFAIRLLESTIL